MNERNYTRRELKFFLDEKQSEVEKLKFCICDMEKSNASLKKAYCEVEQAKSYCLERAESLADALRATSERLQKSRNEVDELKDKVATQAHKIETLGIELRKITVECSTACQSYVSASDELLKREEQLRRLRSWRGRWLNLFGAKLS